MILERVLIGILVAIVAGLTLFMIWMGGYKLGQQQCEKPTLQRAEVQEEFCSLLVQSGLVKSCTIKEVPNEVQTKGGVDARLAGYEIRRHSQ